MNAQPGASACVLVIDDETGMHSLLTDILGARGFGVRCVGSGEEGVSAVRTCRPALVLLDLQLPGMNGIEVLRQIRELDRRIPVIMITGYGTIETAVQAIKLGAYDYIAKPFRVNELVATVDRAIQSSDKNSRDAEHTPPPPVTEGVCGIIGTSPAMRTVFECIRKVAQSSSTVLIQGASGTGKELVARAIHAQSARKAHPFIAVNCAALPEGLLESEMFGYEKGAFTGAYAKKEGKFELASGGTLLLDEISEMGVNLQAKLLRVLQEREIDRVGGRKTVKVDVRIIATTNRDLQRMILDGKFREDLYYRLNVVNVRLPTLVERAEDIPVLARFFLERYARENNRPALLLSDQAMELLCRYSWPGNVRELQHVMERIVVMSDGGTVTPEHLPLNIVSLGREQAERDRIVIKVGTPVEEAERQLLLATLQKTEGDKKRAAQMLKMSMRSFNAKLEKIGSRLASADPSTPHPE